MRILIQLFKKLRIRIHNLGFQLRYPPIERMSKEYHAFFAVVGIGFSAPPPPPHPTPQLLSANTAIMAAFFSSLFALLSSVCVPGGKFCQGDGGYLRSKY
jgi:hypothetical protein